MKQDPFDYLHGSPAARSVFAFIDRHGGTMRVGALMRRVGIEPPVVVDAVNELVERGWVKILWRKSALAARGDAEALPFSDAERVVATRGGRHRYRSTWPTY